MTLTDLPPDNGWLGVTLCHTGQSDRLSQHTLVHRLGPHGEVGGIYTAEVVRNIAHYYSSYVMFNVTCYSTVHSVSDATPEFSVRG